MIRSSRFCLNVGVSLLLTIAAHGKETVKALSYPELEVTPRASERLQMEANNESKNRWRTHLPVQISALTTLVAAIATEGNLPEKRDDNDRENNRGAARAGQIVGGGWLILTAILASNYEPYNNGLKEIRTLGADGERQQLLRERVAEEALDAPARVGSRLKWLSVITNLSVSVGMMGNTDETGQILSGLAALTALAPLVFPYHWTQVSDQHDRYKKRVYGPVAQLFPVRSETEIAFVPGLGLNIEF